MMLWLILFVDWLIPAPNPIRLDSHGRSPAIYLQKLKPYRIALYAGPEIVNGRSIGWMCNGIHVGRKIWERDGVYDQAQSGDFPPTLPLPQPQFYDEKGRPAAGGCVCFFKSGTTQPQNVLMVRQ